MDSQRLNRLYQERSLIRELMDLDPARYAYLGARFLEIKMIINSEYTAYASTSFWMFDADLAAKITLNATRNMTDLMKKLDGEDIVIKIPRPKE